MGTLSGIRENFIAERTSSFLKFKINMIWIWSLLLLMMNRVWAQDYTDECPTRFGFYADAVQCDRYYECKDGEIFDKYCPDGLVFDEASTAFAKCSFPFSVDCKGRPDLQPAQPTKLCPRQNGYFAHEDPSVCDKFYFCVDGVPNPITCPASLIFDPQRGQCAYSDQVVRKGCSSVEVFKFECPNVKDSRHEHPRYPDPNDCQFFYICIGGSQARRNGCTDGQVFNKETLACDTQASVQNDPLCRNWYNETFLESQAVPRPRPGGVPLDQTRERVVVRRRKPTQQVSISTSEVMSTEKRIRPGTIPGARPTLPPGAGVVSRPRNKVRTRVRRPPQVAQEELLPIEEGPPTFALSSEEDIQRFRDSISFGPQSNEGRLTVLSGDSRPGQSRPRESLQPQNPIRSFAAIPAVPDIPEDTFEEEQPATFGNRFKSRRPPVRTRPAVQESRPVTEAPVSRFSAFPQAEPTEQQRPRTRPGLGGRRPPSSSESFEPQRVRDSSGGGRQRLEVTEIRVNPQLNQDFDAAEEPLDIDAFRRVASRFRNRGSQQ